MDAAIVHRTLIVANRTAQTPVLLQEIDRRAGKRPTAFTLLVPDTAGKRGGLDARGGAEGDPRRPRAARKACVRCYVDGLAGSADAFESVKQALEEGDFHDVVISTLPRRRSEWLQEGAAATASKRSACPSP